MRFRILLATLVAPLLCSAARAQHWPDGVFWQQETMLASAARTATTYGPWTQTRHTDQAIYCVGDVTVSNTTGTLAFGIQVCDVKAGGVIDGDCDANAIEMVTDGTHLAVVTKRILVSEQIISGGYTASYIDTSAMGPLPPIWRISATHASGNESTYSVDCMWW